MKFLVHLQKSVTCAISNLKNNNLESIIWIVNLVPSLAGFSILNDKITAPFWIVHLSLLTYLYGIGTIVYQMQFAEGAGDFIKSYVNISILILTFNNSYWFLMKRPLLKTVLEQVSRNDRLSVKTGLLKAKHEKLLSVVKRILYIFYGINLTNAFIIYIPHRIDVSNDNYSITPCVGLEPLTTTPNRELCKGMLFIQEITIMTVVLNYQALLLLLISHTTAMYEMLIEETMALNDYDCDGNYITLTENLHFLIERHALALAIIRNLKELYSMPIGVNFGSNAVCISLFFYLPLQEWVTFTPILAYCFLVFFLYCFLCQRLINGSEIFENAVYSCGWEKFDLKDKKTVYVMLIAAQKPVTLLAADIIPVNIYTFATTLQAMFKFITVVKF